MARKCFWAVGTAIAMVMYIYDNHIQIKMIMFSGECGRLTLILFSMYICSICIIPCEYGIVLPGTAIWIRYDADDYHTTRATGLMSSKFSFIIIIIIMWNGKCSTKNCLNAYTHTYKWCCRRSAEAECEWWAEFFWMTCLLAWKAHDPNNFMAHSFWIWAWAYIFVAMYIFSSFHLNVLCVYLSVSVCVFRIIIN